MILCLCCSWYSDSLSRQTVFSHINIFPKDCILMYPCIILPITTLNIKKNCYQYLTNGVAMCTAVTNPDLAIRSSGGMVQCCTHCHIFVLYRNDYWIILYNFADSHHKTSCTSQNKPTSFNYRVTHINFRKVHNSVFKYYWTILYVVITNKTQ